MREIKFRVWDGNYMQYFTPWEYGFDAFDDYGDRIIPHHDEKHQWMQYTGLKDKNGKEIYEGDIVKGWWRDIDDEEVLELVMWWRSGWYAGYVELESRKLTSLSSIDDLEVVGSVYENPELLLNY